MNDANFVRHRLFSQGLPVYDTDISYIQRILCTMERAQASLNAFPNLNQEVPITIVDKELMRDE